MYITSDITKKILSKYLSNFSSLPINNQLHLANRLYRITGDKKYLSISSKIIFDLFESDCNYLKLFLERKNPEHDEFNVRATILRNPVERKRIQRRSAFYKKNSRLRGLVNCLNIIEDHWLSSKLHKGSKTKEINYYINQFKQIDYENFYWRKDHFKANPVDFINNIYTLKKIGAINFRQRLLNWSKEIFSPLKISNEEILYDQVYAYTHLLINESNFYQQFISESGYKKFAWILSFFSKNFDTIYERINLDLIMEMLICFQLCGKKNPAWGKKAYQWLLKHYDESDKFFKADAKSTIEDMEHFHSLLFLHKLMGPELFSIKESLF